MSTTSFEVFYKKFYDKVQNDINFFDYFKLTPDEALAIAQERAKGFLIESLSLLVFKCTPDVNFMDFNEDEEILNFEATPNEVELIASLMYEFYLEKDIVKMRPVINAMTSADVKMLFSPANERKTFMDMFDYIVERNLILIADYASRDRLTGRLKTIW